MFSTIASISSLFVSFGLLILGHGLQNTLISVRAAAEGYDNITIGLLTVIYSFGYIFGTRFVGKYIGKVGHIRTFAVVATLESTIVLLQSIFVNPYAWGFMRLINGVDMACAYVIIESWLNSLSTKSTRGRIMSVYMIVSYTAYSCSQLFLKYIDVTEFAIFAIVSILMSLSIMPLTLSKARQPREEMIKEKVPLKKLFRIFPLGSIGVFAIGLVSGSFWAMSPVFLKNAGLTTADVATFISFVYLGGLLFQWPAGWLSDLINRKFVIALCSTMTIVASYLLYLEIISYTGNVSMLFMIAVLYGAGNYPIYSLFVALANDAVPENMSFVKVSSTLQSLYGSGLLLGPLFGSAVMNFFGNNSLVLFVIFGQMVILAIAIGRMMFGKVINKTKKFVAIPATSVSSAMFDPRRKNRLFRFGKDF